MKYHLTFSKLLSWPGLKSALAGVALLGMAASSSAGEVVIPPSALPYGLSYQEWAAKWWQFYMGQNTNHLQLVGNPDICGGLGSNVRFLYGAPGTATVTRKVSIEHGVALFFSILSAVADNTACPVSDFTTNTAAQLEAAVQGEWGAASLTTCTIDGVAVPGLDDPATSEYNVVSPPFSYTTSENHSIFELVEGLDCIPGGTTVYPAVTDGIYLMLAPLKEGKHTIHFVGVAGPLTAPFLKLDITYTVIVE